MDESKLTQQGARLWERVGEGTKGLQGSWLTSVECSQSATCKEEKNEFGKARLKAATGR